MIVGEFRLTPDRGEHVDHSSIRNENDRICLTRRGVVKL